MQVDPAPRTVRLEQVTENIAATQVHLTAADLANISEKLDALHIKGDRYPAALATMVNR
jgi:diketogulonate reductase-like aldo/keto reductase